MELEFQALYRTPAPMGVRCPVSQGGIVRLEFLFFKMLIERYFFEGTYLSTSQNLKRRAVVTYLTTSRV